MDFPLFAYGTLKRGFAPHARYCANARGLARAWLRGCLFEHASGYPMLVLPLGRIHAIGTADAVADARAAATGKRPAAKANPHGLARAFKLLAGMRSASRRVEGQLLTFPADRVRVRAMDEYEGYRPGRPSLFARVLVDVRVAGRPTSVRAWTYVAGALTRPTDLVAMKSTVWTPHLR